MARYIDFEIAREYLHKACEGLGSNGGLMLKIKFDQEPKADVVPTAFHDKCMQIEIEKRRNMVEVVRCKDCKYYKIGSDDMHYCFMNDSDHLWQDDDYCSYGERREDERFNQQTGCVKNHR